MFRLIALILTLLAASAASAQSVNTCNDYRASAQNIGEPWEQYTRTFANGAIRAALLDTTEPAAGAFYLLILSPPYDELGLRTCVVIGDGSNGDIGFYGMSFDQLRADYDPATGLTLLVPVNLYAPETGGFDEALLGVTINQATGTITPFFEAP